PPFDDSYSSGRVEKQFLLRASSWLKTGGVLALVCPENVAGTWEIRSLLMSLFEQVLVVPFPVAERKYKEVITFAVRREKPVDHWKVSWDDLLMPADHVYPIPPGNPPRVFEKVEMTDEELGRVFAASPLRRLLLATPERPLPSPPLALGMG